MRTTNERRYVFTLLDSASARPVHRTVMAALVTHVIHTRYGPCNPDTPTGLSSVGSHDPYTFLRQIVATFMSSEMDVFWRA